MNLSFIRFTRCYHFYLCWSIMNNRSNWTASKNLGAVNIWVAPPLCVAPPLISLQTFTITWDPCTMPVNGTHGFERKKHIQRQNRMKPYGSWWCIEVLRHEPISLCKNIISFFISDPPQCPTVLSTFTTVRLWHVNMLWYIDASAEAICHVYMSLTV